METWIWKLTLKIHEVLGLCVCILPWGIKKYVAFVLEKARINQFIISGHNVNKNLFRMLP